MKKYFVLSLLILGAFGAGCHWFGTPSAPTSTSSVNETQNAATNLARDAEAQKMRAAVRTGTVLTVGDVQGPSHAAAGSARVVKSGDKLYLALSEDFYLLSTVPLQIQLSRYTNLKDAAELNARGSLPVGDLTFTSGGQLYELPAGTDWHLFKSAVFYSKTAGVIFAAATFQFN